VTRHGAAVPRGLDAAPEGRFGRLVDLDPCPAGPDELEALVTVLDAGKGVPQSSIPAGFTYLGQFIDHDITFDPTPFGAAQRDPDALVDFRTPRLDLDSVYGLGPDVQPFLYDRDAPAKLLLSEKPVLDLPRNAQDRALIGDPRNDENQIVSQLHLLFARFHNRLAGELGSLHEARRLLVRHYHWIVLHEYLPAILGAPFAGPRVHFTFAGDPFIPVEFSGAAFRFGHSMVRRDYGLRPLEEHVDPVELFPGLDGSQALTADREIFWGRFFPGLDAAPPQSSGTIDTRLAEPLFELRPGEPVLARRTLRRGVKLGLPSGQALAEALGAPQLAEADLHLETVHDQHTREALAAATPLWYWILCEAQKAGGERLGPLGRTIVGEVLLGLIETDPGSYLVEDPGWEPGVLGGKKGEFPMASFVRFAQGGEPL
jgi:heme peroxidase